MSSIWEGRFDSFTAVRTPADPEYFKAMLEFVKYITDQANKLTF